VRFLKVIVGYALVQVSEPTRALGGLLVGFRDLVIADATVIRLHDLQRRVLHRASQEERVESGVQWKHRVTAGQAAR